MKTLRITLRKRLRPSVIVLPVLLIFLYGCGAKVVYRDRFDSTPIGQPPGPPQIGTSVIGGDVLIAENPFNDISPDRWLQLRRRDPGTFSEYVATLAQPVTRGATVALLGYVSVIPATDPIAMTVLFETPDLTPPGPTRFELLHIDLLANGNIRVNDEPTAEGTYNFRTSITFLIGFDLDASPPVATIVVRGGAEDASTDVEIPASAAAAGLGQVRVVTSNFTDDPKLGLFFINDISATGS